MLVVFAPRNGPEIARVLRRDGRLVVVTPAADHLAELVGPLGLLRVDPDKADRLAATLEPHLAAGTAAGTGSSCGWTARRSRRWSGMGPHARHLEEDELTDRIAALPEEVPVTVAVDVSSWVRRLP